MDIIYKKTSVRYHEVHIYRLFHKWGFSPKIPWTRFVNTASKEEKEIFKKGTRITLANPKRIHNNSSTG
ncbi:MAG TPA: winged helix-turn-helix domain-containing protein [Candidatus Nitrosocosmicus sp.]